MRPKAARRFMRLAPPTFYSFDYDVIVSKYSQPHHLLVLLCTDCVKIFHSSWLSLGTYCLAGCRGDELLFKLVSVLEIRCRFDGLGEVPVRWESFSYELLNCQGSYSVVCWQASSWTSRS